MTDRSSSRGTKRSPRSFRPNKTMLRPNDELLDGSLVLLALLSAATRIVLGKDLGF